MVRFGQFLILAVAGLSVTIVGQGVGDSHSQSSTPRELAIGQRLPDAPFANTSLRKVAKGHPLVVVMTSSSCPVSKQYLPVVLNKMNSKSALYAGVKWLFVSPIQGEALDPRVGPLGVANGKMIAAALGAKTTAEVFLFDATQNLVYRGAMDDQFRTTGTQPVAKQNFLDDAVAALARHEQPSIAETEPPGCALDLSGVKNVPSKVTYHNQIARLINRRCASCHHDGGIAPFSLTDPTAVTERSKMIQQVVDQGIMPPWGAAPQPGHTASPWRDDRSLSAAEKQMLRDWVAAGKRLGDPKDHPATQTYPSGWRFGTPDKIVQLPKPISVVATGTMDYENVLVDPQNDADHWIQSVEIRPTAKQVVHHVLVFLVTPEELKAKRHHIPNFLSFFAGYVPGTAGQKYPLGLAKKLPKGYGLWFQIHYTPNGQATKDQMQLGITYAKSNPKHEVQTFGLADLFLHVPPHAASHVSKAFVPVPFDAYVVAFLPHMHLRGKSFRYEVTYPDGRVETLLDVPRYDFNWQTHYVFAEPKFVPKGSKVRGIATFDNSDKNPWNPDANADVYWGEQTSDEMMLGYIEYYRAKP